MNTKNEDNEELNSRIREVRRGVDEMLKQIKRQQIVTQVTVAAIYVVTFVAIVVVINKLDKSLPEE
jgi:cell division protein FtsX